MEEFSAINSLHLSTFKAPQHGREKHREKECKRGIGGEGGEGELLLGASQSSSNGLYFIFYCCYYFYYVCVIYFFY